MKLSDMSRKEIGAYGEKVAAEFLKRNGFRIIAQNVSRKTGEIDVIARKGNTLHFVEVKTVVRQEFPTKDAADDTYDPSANLHKEKIRRVTRTSEWYVANTKWEGDVQVDAALVWVRARDAVARVSYLPQIL